MHLISNTINFVKEHLKGAEACHDWFHTERVLKNAEKIASTEKCSIPVVQVSALLHDIADPKFHDGDEDLAITISRNFLTEQKADENFIAEVLNIIKNVSFKNKNEISENPSLELKIVQDADRLDAIGAIGIARTFHFGGFKNNVIYDPAVLPQEKFNKDLYKKSNGTTINHFYEKLLLLKEGMHTRKGREMANTRHQFMLQFLKEFYAEWD